MTGAHFLGIVHPTGNPLYVLLGRIFLFPPLSTPAFELGAFSAAAYYQKVLWELAENPRDEACRSLVTGISFNNQINSEDIARLWTFVLF